MFNRPGIDDVYRSQWQGIQDKIMSESDSFISSSSTDELIQHYLSSNSFDLIELDPNRETSITPKKEVRRVPASMRERFYSDEGDTTFEYETIVVNIPLLRNQNIQDLAKLRTSTFTISWTTDHWNIRPEEVIISIDTKGYGFNYADDENKMAEMVKSEIAKVHQWIDWANADITKENAQLENKLREFIEQRKAKLQTDQSKLDSLVKRINIPVQRAADSSAQQVKLSSRPLVEKMKPSPHSPENYVLDHDKVLGVVSIIENQGRQFEKTPATYKASGEEDLRNVILVGLNTVFEGQATGETFSSKGKTDIYLHIDKGNILVCECKIWGGKKLYHETIDQLLGYLTWRHNFGIVITFFRQKNLSKTLNEIPEIIETHPSFNTGVKEQAATHFISRHTLPHDEGKEVEIHHLFYNLYTD